jgi:ribosome modulation factor
MRKLKLTLLERAFVQGYRDGMSGKTETTRYRTNGPEHQAWRSGWKKAREEEIIAIAKIKGVL